MRNESQRVYATTDLLLLLSRTLSIISRHGHVGNARENNETRLCREKKLHFVLLAYTLYIRVSVVRM